MDEISETDRIERDLAETRARMDSRLDELQDHLAPKQVLNDVFAYFRGGSGTDFTHDLFSRAKANPVPVALAGIGIAWLMVSSSDSQKATKRLRPKDDLEARFRIAEGNVSRFDDDNDDSYGARLDDARGRVVGVMRNASEDAASYAQRIKDAVASAGQSIREKTHDLTGGAGNAFGQFADGASARGTALQRGSKDMVVSARDKISSLSSNPLALGAVAALVGLVAGSLIPTSDQEEQALGSAAQKLRTTGHDLAQNVVDRGGRIANDTLDAVRNSAESHGLGAGRPIGEFVSDVVSGELGSNIKQVAQETFGAVKDSAQANISGHPAQESKPQDV